MKRPLPPELDAALRALPDGEGLRAVWHDVPVPPEVGAPDAAARDAAWARLQARLATPGRVPSSDEADDTPVIPLRPAVASVGRPAARAPRVSPWAWAAVLAVAVLGGGGAWRSVPMTIAAPAGGRPVTRSLADGSQVTLAPGSAVRVSRALAAPAWLRPSVRTVRLDGEAFFEVARDGRPFEVRTSDATTEVLGTRFDVRSPVAGAGTRVAVEEGRVAVVPRDAASRAVLGAGDLARVEGRRAVRVHRERAPQFAAWRVGGLAALDEPLAVVLAELARRSGVEISLDETARAVGPVSVFYPTAPEAATVVADLATAHGLAFTRTSRGFAVTGAATRP